MKKATILKFALLALPFFSMSTMYANTSLAFRGGEGRAEGNFEQHPQAAQDARAYNRGEENGANNSGNNNGNTLAPNTNWVAPDTTPGPLPPPNNPYPQTPR